MAQLIVFTGIIDKFESFLPIQLNQCHNVACSLYIFLGYKIARVIRYIETGIASGSGFNPDRNDCEDAYIAIHLNLFRNDIFVTNDKGTIEAIKFTISSFIEMTRKRVEIGIRVLAVDNYNR